MKFADMHYMEAFKQIRTASVNFSCTTDDKFINSLDEDGYDEYHYTVSEKRVERAGSGTALTSDSSTGEIYVEETDMYAVANIHRRTDHKLDIEIQVRPAGFKSISNGFMNAAAKMGS